MGFAHRVSRHCGAFAGQTIFFPSQCLRNTTFAVSWINRYTFFPYAISPVFVLRRESGCGGHCQFVHMGDVVEAFRQVTFSDSQSLDSAHHQRVVGHISLVAQESSCLPPPVRLESQCPAPCLRGPCRNIRVAWHVSLVFRTPAYHSMDKYMMSRAEETTPPPCILPCCSISTDVLDLVAFLGILSFPAA